VFEAGFMFDGLLAWTPIVERVAEFAPVVAYDRAGVGESEPDGAQPTPQHVARNLHALLRALEAPPPYVLVAHSLGGVFVRMYVELYPEEVAGVVYIDSAPWMSAVEMREYDSAMGISPAVREEHNASAREGFDDLPNAAIRAEAELIYDQQEAGWPEFQNLGPMPDVPVTVLMTAQFDPDRAGPSKLDCEPRECHDRRIAYRRAWLANLADEVSNGTLIVVNDTGHFIQYEDPELAVWAIQRVVEEALEAPGQ
jgi:pimeloyl-ACP methyl ester carboxylesterase